MSTAAVPAAPRPTPLRARDVQRFLDSYQQAWQTGNAELAASLFTRDARYYQEPFAEPIVGREAIHDYWKSATSRQQDVHFRVKTRFRQGFIIIAEWSCTYRQAASGKHRELAGVLIADFYGRQVRNFREYWLSRTR